jgi:hypothetical protein
MTVHTDPSSFDLHCGTLFSFHLSFTSHRGSNWGREKTGTSGGCEKNQPAHIFRTSHESDVGAQPPAIPFCLRAVFDFRQMSMTTTTAELEVHLDSKHSSDDDATDDV